jgi:hypothetical protein
MTTVSAEKINEKIREMFHPDMPEHISQRLAKKPAWTALDILQHAEINAYNKLVIVLTDDFFPETFLHNYAVKVAESFINTLPPEVRLAAPFGGAKKALDVKMEWSSGAKTTDELSAARREFSAEAQQKTVNPYHLNPANYTSEFLYEQEFRWARRLWWCVGCVGHALRETPDAAWKAACEAACTYYGDPQTAWSDVGGRSVSAPTQVRWLTARLRRRAVCIRTVK